MEVNSYIVRFRNTENQETLTRLVEKLTFQEAASWAYIERNTIGLVWVIEEIVLKKLNRSLAW